MMKKKVKHGISVVVLAVFVFLALGSATLTSKQRKETYARADEYTRTGDSYAEQGQYEQALEEYRKGFAELDRLSSFFSNPNNDASELQKDFKARKSAVQQRLSNADIARRNQKRANAPSAAAAAQAPGQAAAPELPVTEDDFIFVQNAQNNLTITDYTGKARHVEIPATISGHKVTEIGDRAFVGKGLTTLTIPHGVTTIGKSAFVEGYPSLYRSHKKSVIQNLIIPDSVTWIDESAFENCGIQTLTLGKGLQFIGGSAFAYNSIKDLTIPDSVTKIGTGEYRGIGDGYIGAFGKCGIKTLRLGKGLQYIGAGAFSNNAIETLVIPDSVMEIQDGAFQNNSIQTLTLGKSLVRIYDNGFANNQISALAVPASLREIDPGAFKNNKLTVLVIPANVIDSGYAFSGNPLANLTIASTTTRFSQAFNGCPLTRITLPANVDEANVQQFGEGFVNFWKNVQNRKAGTYVFSNRVWILE